MTPNTNGTTAQRQVEEHYRSLLQEISAQRNEALDRLAVAQAEIGSLRRLAAAHAATIESLKPKQAKGRAREAKPAASKA